VVYGESEGYRWWTAKIMDRVVREIPIDGKCPLVSEPRFQSTKQRRKLVAKV
jgi:hypothetical protein